MQITFPNSGYTITWPELPPDALDGIVRATIEAYPKPPELTDAQLADPETLEAAVDAHVRQIRARYDRILSRIREQLAPLLAQHLVDPIDTEAVRRLRADMAAIGTPLPADMDDREVFLRHQCLLSFDDRVVLYKTLIKLSPRLRGEIPDDPRWHAGEG